MVWRRDIDYTITPSIDGLFIILKIKGIINREIAMRLNLEAHALGKQLQVRRYLVDVTEAKNTETTTENYQFAYSDMQQAEDIDKHARVATIVNRGDHSHDFIETVARNSGLNVKHFTDREQAERWLTEDVFPDKPTVDDR